MTKDIAIIGMSGLFPGAKDIQTYWQNILNKVDNLHEAPDDWASPYFDPHSKPREDPARIYTRKVGLLGDLATFNPLEFGIPPNAVDGDPGHFLALKLARDALQDANYLDRPFNRETTGVILGRGSNPNRGDVGGVQCGLVLDQTINLIGQLLPHLEDSTLRAIRTELLASLPSLESEKAPTLVSNVITGRIANRLNLMGPNYLVDAACSSCLIAVEQAMGELLSGRSDLMLAGGVQGSMPPLIYQLFCQLNALSRSNIRPFDAEANGTLLSEGAGFLVLKRLEDARRDRDRIYAVIKGIGISSDGKALGLLAPRLEGEVLALHRAYEKTGIEPKTLSLIEAHGTGIPLGDKTEIQALTKIFGAREEIIPQIALGSVKSMIGHCIPASGVASLIKMALSLYHKVLPPTLCEQVNPELQLETTPFYINNETRPWIHGKKHPRRAGINAFGFGGINAHAILEEFGEEPEVHNATVSNCPSPISTWSTELLIFSGSSRREVINVVNQVREYLAVNPDTELGNLAYTLANQALGTHRLAVIVKDRDDCDKKLSSAVEKLSNLKPEQDKLQTRNGIYYRENPLDEGKTAFLFSSEGAQYPNMLADLCIYFPQVRQWFDFLDETFPRQTPPSAFIFPPPTSLSESNRDWAQNQLYAGDLATEALFSASMGIYELLRDFEIECDVMVGHSAGEHLAAKTSGLAYVESREHLKQELRHLNHIYRDLEAGNHIAKGVLLSVGAVGLEFIQQLIYNSQGLVHLVADNCPNQVLLFTQTQHSEMIINHIQEAGGICVPLPFDRACHTPLFEPVMASLQSHYAAIAPGELNTTFYSCATTEPYPEDTESARALCAQQWILPVHFRETIEKVYHDEGVRTFIEVGCGGNLTAFVDNILQGHDYVAIASNSPRKSGLSQIQTLLAKLFVQGKTINMSPLYQHRQVMEINLNEVVTSKQESAPVLNLLLPKMSLRQEFVTSIQNQLNPHGNQKQELLAGDGERGKTKTSPTLPSPLQVTPSQEAGKSTPVKENHNLSILESHFELMDEFLANQSRVTKMLFASQDTENNGRNQENN